jgi:hypothetical protein
LSISSWPSLLLQHFHNQCEALGIPSFPYIAVADRDRMGLDHTISESLSIQEGINTLLLCWRWPGAVPYDSLLLNSIPQDQVCVLMHARPWLMLSSYICLLCDTFSAR